MNPKLRAQLRRERRLQLSLVIVMLVTALVTVLAIDNLLVSFVLAFVANYLLSPIVNVLERRGIPRRFAIVIPFIAAAGLAAFGIYKILPLLTQQATALEAALPRYQTDLGNLLDSTEQRFKGFFKVYNVNFSNTINAWIMGRTEHLSSALPAIVSGSLTVLALAPIFAYFMLQDGRTASRRALSLVPNHLFETALNLHHQLNDQMGGFIRARFIEGAIVGIVVWLGLQVTGFPYASLLGIFAGLTNLIPYLGPIIGAVPAVLLILLSPDVLVAESASLSLAIVASVYIFAQLIDMLFIIPLVVAKIVNLHPVTVIIVIIVGSQIMGVLGMVISIPVASAIKLIFQAFYDHLLESRS